MAEPQKQDQPSIPISVHSQGAESAPISSIPEQGAVPEIGISPDLKPPEVSEDLREAGIRYNTINPPVSDEAKKAGVSPSIPTTSGFVPPVVSTIAEAELTANQTEVNKGFRWQLELLIKKMKQAVIKQPAGS